jgi:hypothetical protein
MQRLTWLAIVCLALALPAGAGDKKSQPAEAGAPSAAFFNGKDLTGWEGRMECWTVRDGAIIGVTPNGLKANTFLCSKKLYTDFELSFQVWLIGKTANSGVQIRSKVEEKTNYQCAGPQCDMGQIYWGSLYGEHFGGMMQQAPKDVVTRALKEHEFNDYYIKCAGNHVTIKLNGQTTVDADFPKMPKDGVIGWQLHAGGPMVVIFRNIRFTDLTTK